MLRTLKAITAGAIVLAIGAAFLIAPPFDQSGSVLGADSEAMAPTWVTGTVEYPPVCVGAEFVADGVVRHDWGYECSPQIWTASDPRLSGENTLRFNDDVYQTDNGFVAVRSTTDFLTNDEGAWICSALSLHEGFGYYPMTSPTQTGTCLGRGGYEGLSAILVLERSRRADGFVGLIFPGDFPPLPETPAAE